jgi:hypothetical protein
MIINGDTLQKREKKQLLVRWHGRFILLEDRRIGKQFVQ